MKNNYDNIYNYFENIDSADTLYSICSELNSYNGYLGDSMPYLMDEFEELFTNWSPLEAIERAYYGYSYNPFFDESKGLPREEFNPNNYYFSFNGYGNLISISKYDLGEYLYDYVDDGFIESLWTNIDYLSLPTELESLLRETFEGEADENV
ncbi:MAG: hypothetical protein MJ126_05775 [Lachnospiraceae bacterium]|nr:hypothetical protein [Lachnospiraceae bacterium]